MQAVRRLVHVLVIVLTLVVGAAAAAIIVSQTVWFKNWLRGYIVREANQYLNGQLSIHRLGGNLFFGLEMEDVGVSMDGDRVVAVKDLGLDYNVFEMISKGVSIDNIRLNQPVLYLKRDGDAWSITRLIKKQAQESDREGPAYPIAIDDIGVSDASVVIDDPVGTSGVDVPRRFDQVDASLSFKYEPVRYSIDITHVSFRGSEPAVALNALSGRVSVHDDEINLDNVSLRTAESSLHIDGAVQHYSTKPAMNLRLSSDKTSLAEIARVVPAVAGIPLQPAFELNVQGPLDQLAVTMNVRSSAGQITGNVVADVLAPRQSVRGTLAVRHLDLAPLVKDREQASDITANATIDAAVDTFTNIDSLRGRMTLTSPRVAVGGYAAENIVANLVARGRTVSVDGRLKAYGSPLSAKGTIELPKDTEPVRYDVRGRAQHLDLRQLPSTLEVPAAETDVTASYHVRGSEPSRGPRTVDADLVFEPSTVAGARIEGGSTASVALRGQDVSYTTDATIAALDLQRVGEAFNVSSLADSRFKTAINGHVTATGSGTTPETMQVTGAGTLHDSKLFNGEVPSLTFDAAFADDDVALKADGQFSGFDPADLSGHPEVKGSVGGSLNVDATLTDVSHGVTVDSVRARGRVDLNHSTVGGLAIDRASIDGDYENRTGEVRQLEVVGRDLNVNASGPIALDDHGGSHLTLHADSPNLETIGKLFDVPVSGIATLDATITGNASELQAAGTVVGNNVAYGDNAALAITSKYTARVPDLQFKEATVDADTQTTFLSVAGVNINEVTAKTRYAGKELTFDATARQPERALAAGGALLLHPDHQEVHLERMTLDTRGQRWQLAPGSAATIQYGGGTTTVRNAQLVSGAQSVEADGTFGQSGDSLNVRANNVELANVDALLLREPQFSGRLNATATVSGTADSPRGRVEFQIAQGAFRQFRYDSFAGTAEYADMGITLDTRLQQNATQWFTAKGYVPQALFTSHAEDGAANTPHEHVPPATPAERVDLTIDSSPIDLGLVQGFTTALTGVSGTVEAHVRVEGSATDPHPTGTITVSNGAATVAPLGMKYQQIDGRIDLQPDRVHIDRLTVVDNHKSPLSVTGDLALHERELGAVAIRVTADDFKLIDNAMGNVRVKTSLALTGELTSPRVEGTIAMTTGQLNVDEILSRVGSSPYATTPTGLPSATAASEVAPASQPQANDGAPPQNDAAQAQNDVAPQTPGETDPFDALAMNIRVTVPDDLVVKASNLQAPGSSFGLGALNATLGGDLTVTKDKGGPVRLVGVVNTIRGNYDFQGRRFEILRDGSVRFTGDDFNPRLDLRTRRMIQGVEARVNVTGTVQRPSIVLSSTPPLEDADILSLIVFNQPINELGEGQQISLTARAQSIAAGAITGQLAQSLGKLLDLDTFEINLAPDSGAKPEVTIGQQVGQDLYVKVEQAVDLSTINFVLEYELNKWLRFRSNVQEGSPAQQSIFRRADSTGADLLFFFSF